MPWGAGNPGEPGLRRPGGRGRPPRAQDVLASSNACAEEAFMSSRVVRATGTEAVEQQRYMDWLQ